MRITESPATFDGRLSDLSIEKKGQTHMDKDVKHFVRPFRIGNIIIMVLGGIIFIPLFLGLVGMALMHLFGLGGR
jgi:hypothetical protein